MVTLSTRVIHTHDTEENWNKCTTFIPKKGEMIVYDVDENYSYQRFKLGDGITTIVNLPFVINKNLENILNIKDGINYVDGGRITDY